MTPVESASGTCGTGMPIGSAPRRVSMSLMMREPPRIFMPLQILELGHRVLGVEQARAVRVDAEQLDAGELVHRVGLDVFLERDRGGLALGHHERQLEDFRFGEAAGRVAEHGPDQIDDAVLGLVVEIRRCAAELHGRIELELEPAARGFLDPLASTARWPCSGSSPAPAASGARGASSRPAPARSPVPPRLRFRRRCRPGMHVSSCCPPLVC